MNSFENDVDLEKRKIDRALKIYCFLLSAFTGYLFVYLLRLLVA
ncbi:MAG: hypothetical protein QW386_02545 [Candidatus Bathyarchaeia archaeon]